MKKVLYGFISILIVCCIDCSFFYISTYNMKNDVSKMEKEIENVKEKINDSKNNNDNLAQTYEKLKLESSDKIEEKQIWQETKVKLEQALSK